MSENLKQAFPDNNNSGMTLRDYFAAKAMVGLCENVSFEERDEKEKIYDKKFIRLADFSYRISDAMMEARK